MVPEKKISRPLPGEGWRGRFVWVSVWVRACIQFSPSQYVWRVGGGGVQDLPSATPTVRSFFVVDPPPPLLPISLLHGLPSSSSSSSFDIDQVW